MAMVEAMAKITEDTGNNDLVQQARTDAEAFGWLYSNGNNASDLNHYIEVEVYGMPVE